MAVSMMAPETADLGSAFDRIAKLEKANRALWITTFTLTGLVVFVAGFAIFASQPAPSQPIVSAQGFSLVDEKGNPRGVFGTHEGKTVLAINDGNNIARVALSLDTQGTAEVAVRDNANGERLSMTVDANGNPSFSVVDNRGKIRLVTGMNNGNDPVIGITNEAGATVWHAP
jgi:hypothetical protein